MRFLRFRHNGKDGLAVVDGGEARGLTADQPGFPGEFEALVAQGADALAATADRLRREAAFDFENIEPLPPLGRTGKILCLGLNYPDHAKEANWDPPKSPTIFARYPSSFVGHRGKLVRPKVSQKFDYEGELVAVIGKSGRHIPREKALDHVIGYSIFNDGSIRDFQMETSQWTVGKNFDRTGAFGPWLVTADEVAPGASGLRLQTRLNGQLVQDASTSEMIFDVAAAIAYLSQAMTLAAGDVLVMGTAAGVGMARKPPLFMKPGDLCEVEIESLGVLSNTVIDET
jgi:2-keto-4-pentenoate hydratase/2-oxohepta-3-ene-1,7-dioic acid hydratase in catechol pathway